MGRPWLLTKNYPEEEAALIDWRSRFHRRGLCLRRDPVGPPQRASPHRPVLEYENTDANTFEMVFTGEDPCLPPRTPPAADAGPDLLPEVTGAKPPQIGRSSGSPVGRPPRIGRRGVISVARITTRLGDITAR